MPNRRFVFQLEVELTEENQPLEPALKEVLNAIATNLRGNFKTEDGPLPFRLYVVPIGWKENTDEHND